MVDRANLICQSEVLHQLVLDRDSMEELGRVEQVWMYPAQHRVLGFVCKSGLLKAKRLAFNLPQIHRIGHSGILVKSGAVETEASKVRQLDSLLHCEVWSDAGEKLGKVTDYQFDLKTGSIHCYLFAVTGWRGLADGVYCLPPDRILSYGKSRILVTEVVARALKVYREGIRQKLDKAKTGLKQDYGRVTQEFKSLANQAQTTVGQVKSRWQNLTSTAHDRAQTFSETARQRGQTWTGQVRQRVQTWREQVQQQIQSLAEDPAVLDREADPPQPSPTQASSGSEGQTSTAEPASILDPELEWHTDTDRDWDWDESIADQVDSPTTTWDQSEPWEDWQETAPAPATQTADRSESATPNRTLIPPPPASEPPNPDSAQTPVPSSTPTPHAQTEPAISNRDRDDDLDDDPWI